MTVRLNRRSGALSPRSSPYESMVEIGLTASWRSDRQKLH